MRVEAVSFAPRTAPAAGDPGFSRRPGSTIGVVDDGQATLDFLEPFAQGSGIASGDFDNDGLVDLAIADRDRVGLFRNLGDRSFGSVPLPRADRLGAKLIALVDIDDDGWLDLYLGALGDADYFVLNDRRGFADPKLVPVPHNGALFTEAASFFDLDRDADLDFVKGHWFFLIPRTAPSPAATNYLVRTDGLKFEQAALDEIVGETLTALFTDFNGDGEADLVVGNDFMEPDIYYVGAGGGRLRQLRGGESVPISTLATMSVDSGDIDNDLVPDLYLTARPTTSRRGAMPLAPARTTSTSERCRSASATGASRNGTARMSRSRWSWSGAAPSSRSGRSCAPGRWCPARRCLRRRTSTSAWSRCSCCSPSSAVIAACAR